MKKIELSQEKFALVSDEDYKSLSQVNWTAYRIAGTSHTGKVYLYGHKAGRKYTDEEGNRKKIWMHNAIMNPPKGMVVDHIDGDPLNNQRSNLRVVTHKQNCMNRGKRSNGKTSEYLGVSFNKEKKKFRASIGIDGKNNHLGWFKTQKEAALAYNAKATEVFGEFARINLIE